MSRHTRGSPATRRGSTEDRPRSDLVAPLRLPPPTDNAGKAGGVGGQRSCEPSFDDKEAAGGRQADMSATGAAAVAGEAPLSLNQEFVSQFDMGSADGPFGSRYHVVAAWRVTGAPINVDALGDALLDVVARHEALRTRIAGPAGHRYQEILPPSPVRLDVRDGQAASGETRDEQIETLLQGIETETIGADETPSLRAVLARFDDQDAVLALMTHHLGADALSLGVIIRDLANRYAARTGHSVPDLPPAPQYREFAGWQREGAGAGTDAARDYWRRKLDGAQFTAIPTDFPRSAGLPESTGKHRFLIARDVVSAVERLAATSQTTSFVTLAAMYQLLVHRLTGATDIVIATFTAGRGGDLFQETVGACINFMPLRTDIAGCKSYGEVLERTRQTCLEAFSHEVPAIQVFGQAPELMRPAMTDNATAMVFQSVPDPKQLVEAPGDLKYVRITRRLSSQSLASALPDGALLDLNEDPSGDAIGVVSYKRNLFREDTIASMTAELRRIAHDFAFDPDASPGLT
ncbi:condensation domain-containing protein [Actinoplanes sp. NPDC026623]|uniref:condensation domain-containing protein n=1 Tax=Actinoplanes sp. NPDC026623 TaxID=3155610 RepID=UPI0033E7974A